MKRFIAYTLASVIALTGTSVQVSALGQSTTTPLAKQVQVSKISYLGRDYIPLRQTFEALGYGVNWQEENNTVSIDEKDAQLMLRANEGYFLKDGVLKQSTYAPLILKNKMYISNAMAYQIFADLKALQKDRVLVTKSWIKEPRTLPKLKNNLEYEKLMSFYPSQRIYYSMATMPALEGAPSSETAAPVPVPSAQDKGDFSQTNNQVAGVDEADSVKTDGNYLYTLKQDGIQIFKLGRDSKDVYHQINDPTFYPSQLFLSSDYLIVIGQENRIDTKVEVSPSRMDIMPIYRQQPLMVRFYKLSDIVQKKTDLVMSYGVEGSLVSARMVGQYVYLVANQYTYYGPMATPVYYSRKGTGDIAENVMKLDGMQYFPGQGPGNVMYTVGIDTKRLDASGLDVKSYIGGGYTTYANADSMYLAGQQYGGMWWRQNPGLTDLYAFDLSQGKISFRAKGAVEGDLLNQFSMDEYNGTFRIATTRWLYNEVDQNSNTSNDLTIFDKQLQPLGSLKGLAPGERIYSSRFIAEKLYMVTYRQVDPFYVIDTSNATTPRVLGYLKIPGYSSYLHPYDANTIIGVGMETQDLGDRVVNAGVKISLFDVSDFTNPIEKDKMVIGRGNSYTDVSYDHKAFLFSKSRNIMALPILAESDKGLSASKDAYILSFTPEGKLNLRGKITHSSGAPGAEVSGNWEEYIKRILYVGNDLYTLSEKWLQLNDFDSLSPISAIKR